MSTVVLDTNAFLRFILDDIPPQADEVERILEHAKQGKLRIMVPQIVLFEIEFALRKYYNFPKEDMLEKLTSLISMSYVHIQNKATFRKSLQLFKHNTLSLADCFIKTYAVEKNAELFTFDKKLKNLI